MSLDHSWPQRMLCAWPPPLLRPSWQCPCLEGRSPPTLPRGAGVLRHLPGPTSTLLVCPQTKSGALARPLDCLPRALRRSGVPTGPISLCAKCACCALAPLRILHSHSQARLARRWLDARCCWLMQGCHVYLPFWWEHPPARSTAATGRAAPQWLAGRKVMKGPHGLRSGRGVLSVGREEIDLTRLIWGDPEVIWRPAWRGARTKLPMQAHRGAGRRRGGGLRGLG
jgi:hypothetical protein